MSGQCGTLAKRSRPSDSGYFLCTSCATFSQVGSSRWHLAAPGARGRQPRPARRARTPVQGVPAHMLPRPSAAGGAGRRCERDAGRPGAGALARERVVSVRLTLPILVIRVRVSYPMAARPRAHQWHQGAKKLTTTMSVRAIVSLKCSCVMGAEYSASVMLCAPHSSYRMSSALMSSCW